MALMGRDGVPPSRWFVWHRDTQPLGGRCSCKLSSDLKTFVYTQLILSYLGSGASKHLIEQGVSRGEGNRAVKGVSLARPEFLSPSHVIFFFLLAYCSVEKGRPE